MIQLEGRIHLSRGQEAVDACCRWAAKICLEFPGSEAEWSEEVDSAELEIIFRLVFRYGGHREHFKVHIGRNLSLLTRQEAFEMRLFVRNHFLGLIKHRLACGTDERDGEHDRQPSRGSSAAFLDAWQTLTDSVDLIGEEHGQGFHAYQSNQERLPPSDVGRDGAIPLPETIPLPYVDVDDLTWAEQNRRINDLLMRNTGLESP